LANLIHHIGDYDTSAFAAKPQGVSGALATSTTSDEYNSII
jgi:hypothetical protein